MKKTDEPTGKLSMSPRKFVQKIRSIKELPPKCDAFFLCC
jgi:hypothetical protein